MTLAGATLQFDEPCVIALAGAECDARIGEATAPMLESIAVRAGDVLACGAMKVGVRTYLAVQGGFDVPLVLGSKSTSLSGGFGGFEGRALKKGDTLRVGKARRTKPARWNRSTTEALYASGPLRVTRSTQQDWFEPDAFEAMFAAPYGVSDESNRFGLRLEGMVIAHRHKADLLTEGVSLGAVQILPTGQPVILFVDQQTTGGYPKIANVIAADIHRVGQLRPRDELQFAEVTIENAVQLLRDQEKLLEQSFLAKKRR